MSHKEMYRVHVDAVDHSINPVVPDALVSRVDCGEHRNKIILHKLRIGSDNNFFFSLWAQMVLEISDIQSV